MRGHGYFEIEFKSEANKLTFKVPCAFWSSKTQNCEKVPLCTNEGMNQIFNLF